MAATVAFAAVGILVAKISSLTRAAFNGAMPVRYVKRTRRDNNPKDVRIIDEISLRGTIIQYGSDVALDRGAKNSNMSERHPNECGGIREKA